MKKRNFKYIYGPVASWRLGNSLGIDPISAKGKICSFDCIYCQLQDTQLLTAERRVFVPTAEIIEELGLLPPLKVDYITFSGRGEPTLAKNLGNMIRDIKKIREEKIAVLTNSSLLYRGDVQRDLLLADFVVAKIDASSREVLMKVNKPFKIINIDIIISGIKKFRSIYKGKLALQIMFIAENKQDASNIASLAREIAPDEIQINTPLRPSKAMPLSEDDLDVIERYFEGLNTISVYKSHKKKVKPISDKDTLRRRGKI